MRNRLSARLDKIEQRVTPEKPYICRRLIQGQDPEPEEVLDRMVADGEIKEDQRDDVMFIVRVIVDPPSGQ